MERYLGGYHVDYMESKKEDIVLKIYSL